MSKGVPDRWLKYQPFGERVEGTRFIAFKAPLSATLTKRLHKEKCFDVNLLLKSIPNLGMVIDLTNTTRYYDPKSFNSEGVAYQKIAVVGHVTPSDSVVKKFKLMVLSFLNNNRDNDKLIGVHCTHGVNRTGYLICNFMISEMSIDSKEAMRRFNTARGHRIERNNYVESLRKLKGNSKNSDAEEELPPSCNGFTVKRSLVENEQRVEESWRSGRSSAVNIVHEDRHRLREHVRPAIRYNPYNYNNNHSSNHTNNRSNNHSNNHDYDNNNSSSSYRSNHKSRSSSGSRTSRYHDSSNSNYYYSHLPNYNSTLHNNHNDNYNERRRYSNKCRVDNTTPHYQQHYRSQTSMSQHDNPRLSLNNNYEPLQYNYTNRPRSDFVVDHRSSSSRLNR